MRVYQFRHIRADGQCSGGFGVNRGLLALAVAALALPLVGSAAPRPPVAGGAPVELVALLDGKPLAERPHARAAIEREQASVAARISAAVPGSRIRWRYQLVLNGFAVVAPARRGGPDRGDSRRARGAAERPLPPHALPEPAGDRRAAGLGPDAGDRGQRDQDRRDRRRRRPVASVLLAGRLLDARRLSEGQRRLHDAEGDRRALVPAPGRQLALREAAVRPAAIGARHPRGGHRGRRPRHDREGACRPGAGLRASRPARISATTAC